MNSPVDSSYAVYSSPFGVLMKYGCKLNIVESNALIDVSYHYQTGLNMTQVVTNFQLRSKLIISEGEPCQKLKFKLMQEDDSGNRIAFSHSNLTFDEGYNLRIGTDRLIDAQKLFIEAQFDNEAMS